MLQELSFFLVLLTAGLGQGSCRGQGGNIFWTFENPWLIMLSCPLLRFDFHLAMDQYLLIPFLMG